MIKVTDDTTTTTTTATAIATAADTTTAAAAATTTRSSSTPSSHTDSNNIMMIKERIENATEGLPSSSCFSHLSNRVLPASIRGKDNVLTICDYISSMKSEINPSDHYREDTIISLCNLSMFFNNDNKKNNNNSINDKTYKEIKSEA